MIIIINNIGEHEKELIVNTPWVMIETDYNDLVKRYSKLSFKGFRPGKAPLSAIESHFRNYIKNDLLTAVSTRLCRKALKEKGMIAGSPIEITESELKKNENLVFKANFIEMPSFDLPDYIHLNLKSTEEEAQLDEISEKLLEQTVINLPSSFIENELKYSDLSDEPVSEEEKEAAANRVKLMLILKKIADQNNIEVDDRDIEERIKALAEENEITSEQLKEFLVTNKGLSRLADSLLAEQVFQYIIQIQEQVQ